MAREAACAECGQELGIKQIAKLDDDADPLCEDCTSATPSSDEA